MELNDNDIVFCEENLVERNYHDWNGNLNHYEIGGDNIRRNKDAGVIRKARKKRSNKTKVKRYIRKRKKSLSSHKLIKGNIDFHSQGYVADVDDSFYNLTSDNSVTEYFNNEQESLDTSFAYNDTYSWATYTDENGYVYHYNHYTNESVWAHDLQMNSLSLAANRNRNERGRGGGVNDNYKIRMKTQRLDKNGETDSLNYISDGKNSCFEVSQNASTDSGLEQYLYAFERKDILKKEMKGFEQHIEDLELEDHERYWKQHEYPGGLWMMMLNYVVPHWAKTYFCFVSDFDRDKKRCNSDSLSFCFSESENSSCDTETSDEDSITSFVNHDCKRKTILSSEGCIENMEPVTIDATDGQVERKTMISKNCHLFLDI